MYSEIYYRIALPSDTMEIAHLHKKEISTGFLSTLNVKILELLYREIISTNIIIVSIKHNKVLGYISCAKDLNKLYLSFIFNNIMKVLPYLIWQAFSFSFLVKVTESLLIPFKYKSKKINSDIEKMPELLSIVVSRDVQRGGIGNMLLKNLEELLRMQGFEYLRVVAGAELTSANQFYLKNNFVLFKEDEVHKGSLSKFYYKKLNG